LKDEFNVDARAGLLAELRVLLGAGCLLAGGGAPRPEPA
jgi:hypothetical protein